MSDSRVRFHSSRRRRGRHRSAVISSRSRNRWVDQDLCVVDMSSTQRLHVWPQGGGAVECDRAEVTSVTSWLRRARCRSRSARSSAGPRVQAARRSSVAGVEHRRTRTPRGPTRDRRRRQTIDAAKALDESPDPYLDGYVDYIADTLQVTRPRRRLNPSMATSRTPPNRLEICAGTGALGRSRRDVRLPRPRTRDTTASRASGSVVPPTDAISASDLGGQADRQVGETPERAAESASSGGEASNLVASRAREFRSAAQGPI
jgi:hypothetical protein